MIRKEWRSLETDQLVQSLIRTYHREQLSSPNTRNMTFVIVSFLPGLYTADFCMFCSSYMHLPAYVPVVDCGLHNYIKVLHNV